MCLEVAATKLHSWLAGFRYESYEHHIEISVLFNDAIIENERENCSRLVYPLEGQQHYTVSATTVLYLCRIS